jgi:hypothetical protein
MTTERHEEWADMKSNWQATSIAESFMTEKLRWSLRLRMIGSWAWLCLELAGFILLVALAAIQAAMGHVGVAVGLSVLNLVALGASIWARRSPLRSASGSLAELVELTIQRARRSERFAWAQYVTAAAVIAYVAAMYFSEVGDPLAAYHDAGRATAAVLMVGMYVIGVGFYHRYVRRRARRFAEMRQNL